jgi:hypothetical protein
MKIEQRINEEFRAEKLIPTMAHYQLYYQIAMAVFINETSSNDKEISQQLKDNTWDIEPLAVLNTMKTIIENFYEEDDFSVIFQDNIKVNALLHALSDFIQNRPSLGSKEQLYATYHEQICNDTFYHVKMQIHFENEIEECMAYWKKAISSETASQLKDSAYKLLNADNT